MKNIKFWAAFIEELLTTPPFLKHNSFISSNMGPHVLVRNSVKSSFPSSTFKGNDFYYFLEKKLKLLHNLNEASSYLKIEDTH